MLENLRRKSLVKNYNDPTHQVALELGYAHYENHLSIEQYKQRLSKKKINESFQNPFTQVSKGFRLFPFSLGNINFNMIACPSGTFTMGHEKQYDNQPRIEIIERPFLLGETEVIQDLYQATRVTNPSRFTNSYFKNKFNYPVEQVSWEDAILFCNELSKLQGLDECYTKNPNSSDFGWDCDFNKNGYRLPTEKEWEYAAKAGTENKWAGTDAPEKLNKYATFDESKATYPVKTRKPNEWGFYDMSGNVWEWCWDRYNRKDPKFNADRVARGGGWNNDNTLLHIAYRGSESPNYCDGSLGFRVARSIVN